jgi:predicted MPP superfamily phosphohydrolase
VKLRGRRARFAAIVLVVSLGIPLPAWLTLARLTGRPGWVAAAAALLTVPFLVDMRTLWEHRPRSTLHLYLVMWPFFVWWTICIAYLGLLPLALLVAAVTPVALNTALAVAGVLAVLGGLRALSRRPRIYRHTIAVEGLAPGFAGYRIAQITDIHCGPFTPEARVRRWVQQTNDLGADLITVTGDLITSGATHVPAVAGALGGLRAPDGAFGCMGNHDYFTDGEAFADELERRGLPLLRNRGVVLERGGGQLYLCGVDDTWTRRHDIARALRARPPGVPAVLLAHDPALFGEAAAHGVALTLSGHTHGGQLAIPVAPRRWNLARLMTPFSVGLYRLGSSVLYVNRGLGTTGPPVRVGVRPEIAVLTLVPASARQSVEQPVPQGVAAAK